MSQESDYISEARKQARNLWNAYLALKGMQSEWNALDYGSTLDDGVDANAGYTADEVGAVVFDTADALTTLFNTGHATNIAKLL